MKYLVITNNDLVSNKYNNDLNICYEKITFKEVLTKTRDMIHKGHKLLTHPLSSSLKPNETPYKSIIITDDKDINLDYESLYLIENCILTYEKFEKIILKYDYTQKIHDDFKLVDLTALESALNKIA